MVIFLGKGNRVHPCGLSAYEEACLRTHLPYVVMDVSKSGYSIIKIILIIEVRVFFPDLCIFHVSSAIL